MFAVTALYAEYFDGAVPLPEHEVVFNAIGDADLCREGLEQAAEIIRRSSAPVINPPERILPTGRRENARRLGHLDGVIAPQVDCFSKYDLTSMDGPARLAQGGFEFPVLLRAPGFHTGQHFARIENATDLAAAAKRMPGENILAMEYLDATGTDGLARKYRVMFVDGQFYPVHMAASPDWKVHYVTSDMANRSDLRAEEERFLDAMPEVLGPRTMSALECIRDTLGLDYGGVDFALARGGRLLLFEANATMTILPPGPDAKWDYRRAAIARVLNAARQLVIDRASCAKWSGRGTECGFQPALLKVRLRAGRPRSITRRSRHVELFLQLAGYLEGAAADDFVAFRLPGGFPVLAERPDDGDADHVVAFGDFANLRHEQFDEFGFGDFFFGHRCFRSKPQRQHARRMRRTLPA